MAETLKLFLHCEVCQRAKPEAEVLEVQVFGEHDLICVECLQRIEALRGKDHIREGR